MTWISQNWFFILFALLFAGMHLGHGGHGGHGTPERLPARGDDDVGPRRDAVTGENGPSGHHH